MFTFFILRNFQYKGKVYRTNEDGNATLSIGRHELKEEIKKGRHPKDKKKWLSPVLNHCDPANDETLFFVYPEEKEKRLKEEKEEAEAESEENIRKGLYDEFDAIGKAYDRRWGLDKLKNELVKAQKLVGK